MKHSDKPRWLGARVAFFAVDPRIWLAVGLWLTLVLVTLFARPLWPIDETRAVGVAWEMWLRGDFLVPYMNGVAYSDKPPLLYWLIQFGWWVFGVNDIWPRLVAPLFALANLFLAARLARLLWPDRPTIAQHVPLVLLGCLLWTFFTTFTLYDMLIACFTLLGLTGVLHVWRFGGIRGWLLLACAIALGMLAKGPVILLHVLPVSLLAPWWAVETRPRNWLPWYGGLLGAVLCGIAVSLAWALPAASAGGEAYRDAILWGQTANRMVTDIAHPRSWWWYLAVLPALLFPWSVWPPVWRGLRQLWAESRIGKRSAGVRFCLMWLAPALVVCSLISGKQEHYLMPLIPAFALLIACALVNSSSKYRRMDPLPTGVILFLAGTLLALAPLFAPTLAAYFDVSAWVPRLSPWAGVSLVMAGALLMLLPLQGIGHGVAALSMASALCVMVANMGLARALGPDGYDLRNFSAYLNSLQRSGSPILHLNKYHGQYQFLGRLQPIDVVDNHNYVRPWLERNPQGRVIIYYGTWYPFNTGPPEYVQMFRGTVVTVWKREPMLLDREWIAPDKACLGCPGFPPPRLDNFTPSP